MVMVEKLKRTLAEELHEAPQKQIYKSISLPDRFAYTVHIDNFVRDFIRAFFKDFSVGGGAFLKRDLSVRYVFLTYHA